MQRLSRIQRQLYKQLAAFGLEGGEGGGRSHFAHNGAQNDELVQDNRGDALLHAPV